MSNYFHSYDFQAKQARFRVKLNGAISRLIYGRKLADLTRSSIHSVDEWSAKEIVSSNLLRTEVIFPAAVARYPFPASYPATFRRDKSFDTIKLCEFRNVVVSPHTGLFYFPDKTILQESVGGLTRILGWGQHIHEVLLPHTVETGEGGLVPLPGGLPYFHWLLEAFPRFLRSLALVKEPTILTSKNGPSFAKEGILLASEILGRSFPVLEAQFPVLASRASFCQCDDWSGFVHPEIVAMMREVALFVTNGIEAGSDRIYISRRRAKLRPMENEEHIENELENMGFKIMIMEDIDLTCKWQTLASASVVVSPHGAGLSNLIACRTGTQVLEIFPPETLNDSFARLCIDLKLSYHYLRCKSFGNASYRVDLSEFLETVKQICKLPSQV